MRSHSFLLLILLVVLLCLFAHIFLFVPTTIENLLTKSLRRIKDQEFAHFHEINRGIASILKNTTALIEKMERFDQGPSTPSTSSSVPVELSTACRYPEQAKHVKLLALADLVIFLFIISFKCHSFRNS